MFVGVLGLGNLGGAVVRGLIRSGMPSEKIIIFDVDKSKVESFEKVGVRLSKSISSLQRDVDVLFLCVKPKDFESVAFQLSKFDEGKVLVSFVGGLKLEIIKSRIKGEGIFRAMPNIACEVGEAAIALAAAVNVSLASKRKVEELLSRLGEVYEVDERLIDAFTSLSGSGLAFASETIRSFYEAGILLGFTHDMAKKVALKVFMGASRLLTENDFDDVRKRVATPGGTTVEGIRVLEEKNVRGSIVEAIKAAADKASRLVPRAP
ncbi:MAG: pyrroline-5-carboxylate reductase [Nitrososphaeria archaeon]